MNSKSIIMIAYYFPPEGNAAAYRPLRFLKGLVSEGWNATIISCEPYKYERHDPKLLAQVPGAASIVRVKERDPWQAFQSRRGVRLGKKLADSSADEARHVIAGHYSPWRTRLRELVRVAEACIYRPDRAMSWIGPATQKAITVCHRSQPDMLWSTIGPLSAGVIAYRVSLATGIPYVLDFRDPWGLGYYPEERKRPAWAKRLDGRIISQMLQQASAVVFLFKSVAEAYQEAFPGVLDEDRIHIIPNGFEGEVESFSQVPGERCIVLYAGTLSSYRYDTLLQGLVELKRKNPRGADQLQLRFVGEGLRELSDRVAELGLQHMVDVLPPIPSGEVRRLQKEAHALLILGRNPNRTGHELVAGAKLFGYLQSGRPIIGVVPHDETRRILREVGSCLIADAAVPSEVVTVFERVLSAWAEKTLEALVPIRTACESYSSARQMSDLIDVLNGASRR
ncbi:MAG: glycosyltransferase [Nitrospira sp.]|nr:glycosyltransferase [Nitrospira sp.]